MKVEYDFSNAEKGKFYVEDVKFNVPVYLEQDVLDFVDTIAKKRKEDISTVVNTLIHSDMQLAGIID
jgi:ABC-type transporter MlaC component